MKMRQNGYGGRPMGKGQRYLFWIVVAVVCLVCIQLWTSYDSKMPNAMEKKAFKTNVQDLPIDSSQESDLQHRVQELQHCEEHSADQVQKAECLQIYLQSAAAQLLPPPHQLESRSETTDILPLKTKVAALSEMLRNSTEFLMLKDTREEPLTDTDTNWFMSSLHGNKRTDGLAEEFDFPYDHPHGKILCLQGSDLSDGTKNKYGFAWRDYLPSNSTLLPGITLVADNYWDYDNIWHSMSALVNFVAWRGRNQCVIPQRVIMYHWAELVPSMGSWIENVLQASLGKKLEVETLHHEEETVCLERAVVNRRGLGGVSVPNMNILFDTVRCRARKYCGVVVEAPTLSSVIHVTLLVRTGARAFNDVAEVTRVVRGACEKFMGCRLEVVYISELSFCEQVALMSRTDVLITCHGAQMTNSIFMSKGGSIMELIGKGWLETAGVGQYIYAWLADWSNLHHEGVWHDTEGPDCPYPASEELRCFLFHKDLTIGLNETHLATWTNTVLGNFQARRKDALDAGSIDPPTKTCPCGDT